MPSCQKFEAIFPEFCGEIQISAIQIENLNKKEVTLSTLNASSGVTIQTFAHPVTELPEPAITVCRKVPYNPDEYVRAVFNNFQMKCNIGSCEDTQLLKRDFSGYIGKNDDGKYVSHDTWCHVSHRTCHHAERFISNLLELGKTVHAHPEKMDDLTLLMVSATKRLLAPFYFNYENPDVQLDWTDFWTEAKDGFVQMLSGVEGMNKSLIKTTGLFFEKFQDASWLYAQPIDEMQLMHSVLESLYLGAAEQKYIGLENTLGSLPKSFWDSLATCHRNRTQVRMLFKYVNY